MIDNRWDTRISQARAEADHHIYLTLRNRGYTVAQIDTWAQLDFTRIELGAMFVLRSIRSRLTAPEIEIMEQTIQKVQDRLDNEIPLTSAHAPIDKAAHDDNWAVRVEVGDGGGTVFPKVDNFIGF